MWRLEEPLVVALSPEYWQRVENMPPGTATVEGTRLALVNFDGTSYAIDNECTHRGGYLGEGEINPDWSAWAIDCPLHASVLDVRTGEALGWARPRRWLGHRRAGPLDSLAAKEARFVATPLAAAMPR